MSEYYDFEKKFRNPIQLAPALPYEPRHDRVLVKQFAAPEQPAEGVFIPQSQTAPPNEGIVIAVGLGLRNRVTGILDPVDLKPGDHVCFVEHAGYEVVVDGVSYLQMRDEEIVGRRSKPCENV